MAHVTGIELRALWAADVGENHGDNLPHLGLDCWSPNININRDPRWGRDLETPGEDPYLNGEYGAWHTRGLQEGEDQRYLQAVVTLKHFDAYSLEDDGGDTNITRFNFNAIISKADLAGTYFPAFKKSVREGNAKGVMCSYNAVNGVPSCANRFLLQDVLRDSWNFSGYVTSDSGAVEYIYTQHHYRKTPESGVAAAVKAGCDIDSNLDKGHSSTGSPYTWSLEAAVKKGLVSEAEVDVLLQRSLRIRFELGLFDPIEDQPYWHYKVADHVDTSQAQELNRMATRQGLVLLKNDPISGTTPVLPLKPGGKVAVLGPHARATRALVGNYLGQICPATGYSCVETPAAAIARLNGGNDSVVVVEGCSVTEPIDLDAALAAAGNSEVTSVVMMLGLDTQTVEREGHDRMDIRLPSVQLELLKQVVELARGKKPVIVVLINGGAVALDWLKASGNVDGILEAFYPGKLGAEAIADALFGVYSPGGKMPYSIMPANFTETVDFLNVSMTAGMGRTYRFYKGTPLWPFGYGLSYAKFSLTLQDASDMVLPTAYEAASSPTFQIKVQNIGEVLADEVVQAYFIPVDIQCQHPAPLPQRQLFDFQRLSLSPGESSTIQFNVPSSSLALADSEGNLVSAPGEYTLLFTNGVDVSMQQRLQLHGLEQVIEAFPAERAAEAQLFV